MREAGAPFPFPADAVHPCQISSDDSDGDEQQGPGLALRWYQTASPVASPSSLGQIFCTPSAVSVISHLPLSSSNGVPSYHRPSIVIRTQCWERCWRSSHVPSQRRAWCRRPGAGIPALPIVLRSRRLQRFRRGSALTFVYLFSALISKSTGAPAGLRLVPWAGYFRAWFCRTVGCRWCCGDWVRLETRFPIDLLLPFPDVFAAVVPSNVRGNRNGPFAGLESTAATKNTGTPSGSVTRSSRSQTSKIRFIRLGVEISRRSTSSLPAPEDRERSKCSRQPRARRFPKQKGKQPSISLDGMRRSALSTVLEQSAPEEERYPQNVRLSAASSVLHAPWRRRHPRSPIHPASGSEHLKSAEGRASDLPRPPTSPSLIKRQRSPFLSVLTPCHFSERCPASLSVVDSFPPFGSFLFWRPGTMLHDSRKRHGMSAVRSQAAPRWSRSRLPQVAMYFEGVRIRVPAVNRRVLETVA